MPNGDHGGQSTYGDIERDDLLRKLYFAETREEEQKAIRELRLFIANNWEQSHIRDKKRLKKK